MAKRAKSKGNIVFEGERADFMKAKRYAKIFAGAHVDVRGPPFVIEGQGSVPIYIDGAMHRVQRGVAIEISPEDQDYLTQAGIAFEPAKSEK